MANIFTKAATALCLSLAVFVMFYAADVGNPFLALCGAESMTIYVVHGLMLSPLSLFFRRAGLSETVNPLLLLALSCVIGLAVPLLLVKAYKNVKCLRWIEFIFYPGKLIRKK